MLHPEEAAGPSQPALADARSSCVGMDPGAICNGMTESLLPWEHSPLTQVMTPVKDPDSQSRCATRLAVGILQKLIRSTHTKDPEKWAFWGDEPWKAREPELRTSVNVYQVNPVGTGTVIIYSLDHCEEDMILSFWYL